MIGCSLLMAVGRTVDTSQVRLVGSAVYAFAIYAAVTFWLGVFVIVRGRAGEAVRLVRGQARLPRSPPAPSTRSPTCCCSSRSARSK